jgi:hypothetical protein
MYLGENKAGRNSSLTLARGLQPNPCYGRSIRKGKGRKKNINQIIGEWRQTIKSDIQLQYNRVIPTLICR